MLLDIFPKRTTERLQGVQWCIAKNIGGYTLEMIHPSIERRQRIVGIFQRLITQKPSIVEGFLISEAVKYACSRKENIL